MLGRQANPTFLTVQFSALFAPSVVIILPNVQLKASDQIFNMHFVFQVWCPKSAPVQPRANHPSFWGKRYRSWVE